jgi:DUF3089 family protein
MRSITFPASHSHRGRAAVAIALCVAAVSCASPGTPSSPGSTPGAPTAAPTAAPASSAATPAAPPASGAASAAPTDGPVTDYAVADNWMLAPTHPDHAVDVFYVYGTEYSKANASAPNLAPVDDAGMRTGAQSAYSRQASAFADTANIYAPYYRQLDAKYALNLPQAQHVAAIAGAPTQDITAAFTFYIDHFNHGRPFVVSAHSQGSDVSCNLLAGYLKDHPDVYARMITAYLIGYSVTPDYLSANPHLRFASGAADTGVIVSYNTEAPTIAAPNPVVLPGAMVINPITWTRTTDEAPASASLGSWLPDQSGTWGKVEHYADAQVNLTNGVLVSSTPDQAKWSPGGPNAFPAGVYHSYDYPFYYYDLQANLNARVGTFLAMR